MKRGFIFSFCLILILAACSEKKTENTMTVTGSIDGLKKGTLYLQKLKDSTLFSLDSLELKGTGDFSFSEELESPELFYLYLKKADNNDFNDRIAFFGEPGDINIVTNWNAFEGSVEVTGSNSHEKYVELQEMLTNFNKRDIELIQASVQLDSTKVDSLQKLSDANFTRRYRYVLNFALSNLDSYVTPYAVLSEATEANPKYLDSVYNSLSPKVAESKYGKALKNHIAERKKN